MDALPGRRWALLAILLVVAPPARAQEPSPYEGRYLTGFETSSFTPCAAEYEGEEWWVVADSASYAELQEGTYGSAEAAEEDRRFARAFVRLRGRVSGPGRYGHLGAYDRKIHVTEVLMVARRDSIDCP